MLEQLDKLKEQIESVWEDHTLLRNLETQAAINEVVSLLDKGELRAAEPDGQGGWQVNEWVKKAVILYFPTRELRTMSAGDLEFFDKIEVKHNYKDMGVRVVPPAMARYGSFLGRGVVVMPSFINIGAYIDEGTLVNTWATVGACAQIGKDVHVGKNVVVANVLDPVQASPVIVEDNVFLGAQSIVSEGVLIGREAVLGAGTVISASTPVVDVTGSEPREYKGYVPPYSVVIPGSRPVVFPAGEYHVPCALIIGQRRDNPDKKTSLKEALREFSVQV